MASRLAFMADEISLRALQSGTSSSAKFVLNDAEERQVIAFVSMLPTLSSSTVCESIASSLAKSRGGIILLANIMLPLTAPNSLNSVWPSSTKKWKTFTRLGCEALFAELMREEAEPSTYQHMALPGKRRKVRDDEGWKVSPVERHQC